MRAIHTRLLFKMSGFEQKSEVRMSKRANSQPCHKPPQAVDHAATKPREVIAHPSYLVAAVLLLFIPGLASLHSLLFVPWLASLHGLLFIPWLASLHGLLVLPGLASLFPILLLLLTKKKIVENRKSSQSIIDVHFLHYFSHLCFVGSVSHRPLVPHHLIGTCIRPQMDNGL